LRARPLWLKKPVNRKVQEFSKYGAESAIF
jgi:hypothetical protein